MTNPRMGSLRERFHANAQRLSYRDTDIGERAGLPGVWRGPGPGFGSIHSHRTQVHPFRSEVLTGQVSPCLPSKRPSRQLITAGQSLDTGRAQRRERLPRGDRASSGTFDPGDLFSASPPTDVRAVTQIDRSVLSCRHVERSTEGVRRTANSC